MYCGVKTMSEGTLLNILAQGLGLGGTYMLLTMYQQNDRKKLLLRKLCADALWGIHYVCLGAAAGAIVALIPTFILYGLAQKFFTEGIVLTGIKE